MPKRASIAVAVVAVFFAYLVAYLAVIPPLQGFDAVAHFNYVNYLREYRRLPDLSADVAEYSYEAVAQTPLYYALAALASAPVPFERADQYTRDSENPYQMTLSPRWTVDLPEAPASWRLAAWISRLVSALGAVAAVGFTWLWVGQVAPGRRELRALTTAVVALNPLFIFLAVTTSNDAWAVAGATAIAWAGAWLGRHPKARPTAVFALGCLAGLAALTKYSALSGAVPAAIALLALPESRSLRLRDWAIRLILLLAGGLLTAGFWYGRNVLDYGEIVPTRQIGRVLWSFLRAQPLSWTEVVRDIPWLITSYWGVFVGVISANAFYAFMLGLSGAGLAGLLVRAARAPAERASSAAGLVAGAAWWFSTFALMLNWMRDMTLSSHARWLLPASPGLALVLAVGWLEWVPNRRRTPAAWGLAGVFALLPALAWVAFAEAYRMPTPAEPDRATLDRALDVNYAEGMRIVGANLPRGRLLVPGAKLPLILYSRADGPIEGFHTLFVHVVDDEGRRLFAWDGVPAGGRHPTRQWRPGETFADAYDLALPPDAPALGQTARLVIGFYPYDQPDARLPARDGSGTPVGGEIQLGLLRVVESAATLPLQPAVATWSNGLQLSGVSAPSIEPDGGVFARMTWQAARPLDRDLTVFLHLLDAGGALVAQRDQPMGGALPNSLWRVGEPIQGEVRVVPSPAAAGKWTTAVIGVYDSATGERVPLAGTADTSLALPKR